MNAERLTTGITRIAMTFMVVGAWSVRAGAADAPVQTWRQTTWQLSLELDAPDLVPQAVLWTIMKHDPVAAFKARIRESRTVFQRQLDQATESSLKKALRRSQMAMTWDLAFRDVTGRDMHLLAAVSGAPEIKSASDPTGKVWLVTKAVEINGKPACWCMPATLALGTERQAQFSAENVVFLEPLYQEAMRP